MDAQEAKLILQFNEILANMRRRLSVIRYFNDDSKEAREARIVWLKNDLQKAFEFLETDEAERQRVMTMPYTDWHQWYIDAFKVFKRQQIPLPPPSDLPVFGYNWEYGQEDYDSLNEF